MKCSYTAGAATHPVPQPPPGHEEPGKPAAEAMQQGSLHESFAFIPKTSLSWSCDPPLSQLRTSQRKGKRLGTVLMCGYVFALAYQPSGLLWPEAIQKGGLSKSELGCGRLPRYQEMPGSLFPKPGLFIPYHALDSSRGPVNHRRLGPAAGVSASACPAGIPAASGALKASPPPAPSQLGRNLCVHVGGGGRSQD